MTADSLGGGSGVLMKESFYDPKSSAKVPPKFWLCGYLHHLLFFLVFVEAWLSHL